MQKPKLLSGGNPQIAKADGDAPVQAYIAAMQGWKRELGQRLDGLIVRTVPKVRKAVKWNSPFYGVDGKGWFLSFHVFTRYVKVTFFNGTSLRPVPPGGTLKSKEVRWLDIYEDGFDEKQMASWVKQAASRPGWMIAPSKEESSVTKAKPAKAAGDWRQATLARVRELIMSADPKIVEGQKWKKPSNPAGVPVWSRDGIICTGETYKNAVKLTFMNGAELPDPSQLFNASLDGNMRRAIDIHEGETIDARDLKALVKAAVARNRKAAAR
jgi:hypothetical protein